MPVYDVQRVTRMYPGKPEPANDAVTFAVEAGEFFGLLGDNGAGKTTLVRQMAGLLMPTSGQILLMGRPTDCAPMYVQAHVAYMPQSGLALNSLTVGESLYFTAHLRGLSRSDARRDRDHWLDVLNLGPIRDQSVARISGGQKRLVLLGTTLAASRPVLILDEPTNDLSPQNRRLAWDLLREINREHGQTIILVTHNAIEAERVIQRVGIMQAGQLAAIGRPGMLKGPLNDQLRLEIVFAPDLPPHLPNGSLPTPLAPGRWQLLVDHDQAPVYLAALRDAPGVEDFQLSTATLEDLYLSITERD